MITCKVGRPGEGKSSTTARNIKKWLDQGHQVYTNLHVNESRENYHYFKTQDWQIIFTLQNGIIVFDEGQFILDARQWQETPVEFRQLLQKGRHEGLDFVILTQNIMQIDVAARRLIHEATLIKKMVSIERWNFALFIEWSIDIVSLEKQVVDDIIPVEMYMMTKEDFDYYDTHALRSKKTPPPSVVCDVCEVVHRIGEKSVDSGDKRALRAA